MNVPFAFDRPWHRTSILSLKTPRQHLSRLVVQQASRDLPERLKRPRPIENLLHPSAGDTGRSIGLRYTSEHRTVPTVCR